MLISQCLLQNVITLLPRKVIFKLLYLKNSWPLQFKSGGFISLSWMSSWKITTWRWCTRLPRRAIFKLLYRDTIFKRFLVNLAILAMIFCKGLTGAFSFNIFSWALGSFKKPDIVKSAGLSSFSHSYRYQWLPEKILSL